MSNNLFELNKFYNFSKQIKLLSLFSHFVFFVHKFFPHLRMIYNFIYVVKCHKINLIIFYISFLLSCGKLMTYIFFYLLWIFIKLSIDDLYNILRYFLILKYIQTSFLNCIFIKRLLFFSKLKLVIFYLRIYIRFQWDCYWWTTNLWNSFYKLSS